MIENSGFPDQTYDAWQVVGPSAYSGGLWLAALVAATKMAEIVGDGSSAQSYRETYKKGVKVYETLLWDEAGGYYKYDSSGSGHADSIMTDQMAGQW